jgi:hypothetical protein
MIVIMRPFGSIALYGFMIMAELPQRRLALRDPDGTVWASLLPGNVLVCGAAMSGTPLCRGSIVSNDLVGGERP